MPELFIIRYQFHQRDLAAFLAEHRFLTHEGDRFLPADRGYQVHAFLSAATGAPPRPFSIERTDPLGITSVLAYDAGIPLPHGRYPVTIDHHEFPIASIRPGCRLGFTLRCMPIHRSRKASNGSDGDGSPHDAGGDWRPLFEAANSGLGLTKDSSSALMAPARLVEQDVALSAWQRGDVRDRELIYRDWLAQALDPTVVSLQVARLDRFQVTSLIRRTQVQPGAPRQGRAIRRPDAHLSGHLQVLRPDLLRELLRRGIGRHRAFGFGMLKLRPAEST